MKEYIITVTFKDGSSSEYLVAAYAPEHAESIFWMYYERYGDVASISVKEDEACTNKSYITTAIVMKDGNIKEVRAFYNFEDAVHFYNKCKAEYGCADENLSAESMWFCTDDDVSTGVELRFATIE